MDPAAVPASCCLADTLPFKLLHDKLGECPVAVGRSFETHFVDGGAGQPGTGIVPQCLPVRDSGLDKVICEIRLEG